MKSFDRLCLALALLSLPATALAQEITTVAVAGPMTGGESAFGRQMRNGAEMAVNQINASGGVLGRKLVLDIEDDACDPKQARSVAEKIGSSKIPFVAGHYCSSSSIPASEAYADSNVLQISPASTNPLFTERKLWNVARVCGRDDQQGLVAGEYIAKNYKDKNIAILNDKTTYGKGLADETKKALNKAGVTEKLFASYNKGDKDFNAIVSLMKAKNIDLVYIGGYHQEAGLILRQMRDQGLKTVLMAGDALADVEFASITGPLGEGTLFTFGPDPRRKPTAQTIVEKFKAQGIDPEGHTLYTYAAFQVWSEAVKKAGTTDPKKVMATIKAGSWDTVIGKLEFDAKGDTKQIDYVVYKWDAKGGYAEIGQPSGSVAMALPSATSSQKPSTTNSTSSGWDLTGLFSGAPSSKPSPTPTQVAVAPSVAPSPRPSASPSSLPAAIPSVSPSSGQVIAPAPSAPISLGRRVALVMGNSSYRAMPSLANPKNDAADVAAALKGLGFETIVATDLNRAEMSAALSRFSKAVRGADVAMIYYSGHGMQFEGRNYLLPIDASLETAADVNRFELTAVDDLIDVLSGASGMRLIVLDACRNNAAERDFKNKIASAAGGNRDVAATRGFSRINPRNGLVVAYSTASGEVAADGTGRNSPFTEAFLKNVSTPDMEVRQMLFQVQTDVFNATHTQLPEISSLYVGPAIRLKLSANKP